MERSIRIFPRAGCLGLSLKEYGAASRHSLPVFSLSSSALKVRLSSFIRQRIGPLNLISCGSFSVSRRLFVRSSFSGSLLWFYRGRSTASSRKVRVM